MSLIELASTLERRSQPSVVDLDKQSRQEICDKAQLALQASCYRPIRQIICELRAQAITLKGSVSTFYMKQIAQTLVREVVGEEYSIDNQINVR